MLKNNILQKLLVFSIIILACNGIIGYAVYTNNKKSIEAEYLIQHTQEVINLSGNILSIGKDIESSARGYVITMDSAFLESLHEAEEIIFSNVRQLRILTKDDPAQQIRIDSLEFYIHKRLDFSLQTVDIRKSEGLASSVTFVLTKKGMHYSMLMRQMTNIIQTEEYNLLIRRKQTNQQIKTIVNRLYFSIFLLMTIFTVLLIVITGKYLVQNKEKAKRDAELEVANKEVEFQSHEKEKQENANKELEAFSYSVSHDLRAPLRHVSGFVDLLLKNNSSQLDQSGLRYLNIIAESAQEMGNLIDALLTFSRLSRTELQKEKINTRNLVDKVISTFSDELTGRDVKINISDLPDTIGDENLINQVWINLISNALKYSRNKTHTLIDISGETKNGFSTFSVKDNGAGFDMLYAGSLFGVFQRLHKARDFEGIGIGLANVNRIVVRHGGMCHAEAEIDLGATFSFSIPNKTTT